MNKGFIFLIFFLGIILQVTIFSHHLILGEKPDLILILVLALGFIQGSNRGMSFGFLGGILEDVFSAVNLGTNALSKTLCGFLVSLIGHKVYENITTQAALIIIFSLLDRITTGTILFFTTASFSLTPSIIPQTLAYILYNLLLGFFIFPLIKKISRKDERINRA